MYAIFLVGQSSQIMDSINIYIDTAEPAQITVPSNASLFIFSYNLSACLFYTMLCSTILASRQKVGRGDSDRFVARRTE